MRSARRLGWRRPRRRLWWLLGAVFVLVVAASAASFFVPALWAGRVIPGHSVVDSDAVAFMPGTALTTSNRIEADGIDVYESAGEILLLTVSIDNELTVVDWIRSAVDDAVELRSRQSVFGERSNQEQRDLNRHLMSSAKDTATIVALERLGVHAADFTGVLFAEAVSGGPADGLLSSSDVILSIDGLPVTTVASLLAVLDDLDPGTTATITVEDSETRERRDVEVALGTHPDSGGAYIGVSGVTERVQRSPLPFEIDISSGNVGGPSAGLAFTLLVLDVLTPGELTGGKRVAVTGSIRLDGSVGDVGGVTQKSVAARDAGADIIMVPAALVDEARSGAGEVPVVGVENLDDALEVLAAQGGDPVGLLYG